MIKCNSCNSKLSALEHEGDDYLVCLNCGSTDSVYKVNNNVLVCLFGDKFYDEYIKQMIDEDLNK